MGVPCGSIQEIKICLKKPRTSRERQNGQPPPLRKQRRGLYFGWRWNYYFMESHNHLMIPQIPPAINRIFLPSQNTALWKINKAYLWPRSKGWMRALKASIQPAATKVTNMLYLSSRGRLLCLRQIPIYLFYLAAMHFCFFIIVYAYK